MVVERLLASNFLRPISHFIFMPSYNEVPRTFSDIHDIKIRSYTWYYIASQVQSTLVKNLYYAENSTLPFNKNIPTSK